MLDLLPPIILALAEQRSLNAVLKTIIDAVVRQPDVALARIWLRESNESCPICSPGDGAQEPFLHLRASAGSPLSAGADWSRLNGTFHRVSLSNNELKIAYIANTGKSIRTSNLLTDRQWVRYPAWVSEEKLVAF